MRLGSSLRVGISSSGEGAFAGVAASAALATAAFVEHHRSPLEAVTERWIRTELAGVLPELALRSLGRLGPAIERHPFVSFCAAIVLPVAAMLFHRAPAVRALALVAGGVCGFGVAQPLALYALVLHPFLAPVLLLAVATLALRASGRARRAAGLSLALVAAVTAVATLWSHERHARAELQEATLMLGAPAYDVVIAGVPPALVYTDQAHVFVAREPYAQGPLQAQLLLDKLYAERLVPAADERMLYLATSGSGARRVELGSEVSVVKLGSPEVGWVVTLAEDPVRRRLLLLNEWNGIGLDVPLDHPTELRPWTFSQHLWPMPFLNADPPTRRAYLSNMLGDGALEVIDLDTLTVLRRRDGVFAYQSVVDRERGLLWATRALPGELLGIDLTTLDVRVRVPLAPGPRDVVLDPVRGQLFVNTYPAGELFRVDAASGRVLEEGACGWRCRSLYIDPTKRALWSASLAGVRRFSLDVSLSPAGATR